ncbi:MAG: adenine-specific DNA-methyltransferase, partial [Arcobacteraceae bacterium]
DYFIHKDLGGFLSRELDFYIKNEILYLDDIMESPIKYEEVMGKIKIFKEVSQKIIAFLTQLEELQKKLWEKKKFIIETNYCITLDKIDEKHYEQILNCSEQLAEWKTLFDVDVKTIDDLKEEKYLVLDTKFFDTKFKYNLLSEFDNFDEEIDGVLINSENFGALSLLQGRYKEQIKTVYIDPPYNTGNDGFLYNDSYQHSSWMSFMYDRLVLGRNLMSDDGAIFSSIDEYEFFNLKNILNKLFHENNFIESITWNKRIPKNDKGIGNIHEYIILYVKNMQHKHTFTMRKDGLDDVYNLLSDLKKKETPLKDAVIEIKKLYKKNGYDRGITLYNSLDKEFRLWGKINMCWPNPTTFGHSYEVLHPKTNVPVKMPDRGWRWKKETFFEEAGYKGGKYQDIYQEPDGSFVCNRIWFASNEKTQPSSITYLDDVNYFLLRSVLSLKSDGGKEVEDLFKKSPFSYPKPTNLLKVFFSSIKNNTSAISLDFFAGSGTTGHAVINLNREDSGKRKYILVEMGEYFDTVTKPRIQKVIYTDSWKDGKPTTKNGVSQIFKYFKLESYEDTLNNLEFQRTEKQKEALDFFPEAKEDYILNYSLDLESHDSLLNIDTFTTPFDYKLKIATSSVGETKATTIDLVETFNYLLGLVVKRIELLKSYLVIEGQNLKKEKILIIWRDGQTSLELNDFFKKMDWSIYNRDFDTIYVNGDNNLANLKKDEDHFKVKLIEQEFKNLMFGDYDEV